MAMTPRQRLLALLDGQPYDRVPTDYWSTPEFDAQLKRDLDCPDDESLWRKLHIDAPVTLAPRCTRAHHPDDAEADIWGVRHRNVDYGTGSYSEVTHCPLAAVDRVEQVHSFRWPTADDFDYGVLSEALDQVDDYRAVRAAGYEPFLLYCTLRGLERSFEDLLAEPEIAEAILGHLFDFHSEHNRRIFEAGRGRIDITYVAEDLGSQTGPLMSLDLYRRFLMPNQQRMAALARSYGIHVFFHTDGASYPFIADLIETVGIEVLNPIQWRCPGMERDRLVREFGDKVAFHGAMDNQYTLAFGTVAEVVAEVEENLALFQGARWICAPCHNIQPISPTENIVALYETIHALGRR